MLSRTSLSLSFRFRDHAPTRATSAPPTKNAQEMWPLSQQRYGILNMIFVWVVSVTFLPAPHDTDGIVCYWDNNDAHCSLWWGQLFARSRYKTCTILSTAPETILLWQHSKVRPIFCPKNHLFLDEVKKETLFHRKKPFFSLFHHPFVFFYFLFPWF